jgi:deferrochelatase/peroxidase EfeB
MRGRVPITERGPGWSYRPDATPPSIHGAHQPGVATVQLDRLTFAAFDLAGAAGDVLAAWSAQAERLMDDSLTLTFGLGTRACSARLAGLAELPPFRGDALDPALCGGDLCVQACAADAARAADAVDRLAAVTGVSVRWRLDAYLTRDRSGRTPRDVLGFRHGTGNVRRGRDFDRHVWISGGSRTAMLGGTYLVVRRIEVDLKAWRRLALEEQERVIGRHRGSGAPLGARREFDAEPLPPGSHAALAEPKANGGARLLRRGYGYDGGLLLLAFTADPRRHYVPVHRRLAEHDPLNAFTRHVGSAVFAIPPGARPGGYVGEGL